MHRLIELLRVDLPQETADLADEMVDANESAVALGGWCRTGA